MENDLIRFGLEALAFLAAVFLLRRKNDNIKELLKVFDNCEIPNEELCRIAVEGGLERAAKVLKNIIN